MDIKINRTPTGMTKYPRHSHKQYEIMHYIRGTGTMWTQDGSFPFSEGTVIIIPPNIAHGSVSEDGFINISIECNFHSLLSFDSPVLISGADQDEGSQLIQMIWDNRCKNEAYLHALCIAYAQYLLQKTRIEGAMSICIKKLVSYISDHSFDSEIDIAYLLHQSGYSEDYVRACFKKETGKTPIGFLTELRIKQACYLIDIYKDQLSLSEIAERCGYTDYVYFSKKFKELMGLSPTAYKKM